MVSVISNLAYPEPKMLPPLVGEGALVVDMVAAAKRLVSAVPNSEPACVVAGGKAGVVLDTPKTLCAVGEPNTDGCDDAADAPNTDV